MTNTAGALFNAATRIERVALGGERFVYVIDDALREPERFVAWAAANRAAFAPVDYAGYPGIYVVPPRAIDDALDDFFVRHLRGHFDARRLVKSHCRLAMVTLRPEQLRPHQWLCHTDRSGLASGESIQASVLYLFKDAGLGGTSFYEPTGTVDETARLFADSASLDAAAFSARYGLTPGYIGDTNRYFRRIGHVPARWNRLIVYDGSVLHSGDIPSPDRLADDPRTGRLTLNGFFVCRRRASV